MRRSAFVDGAPRLPQTAARAGKPSAATPKRHAPRPSTGQQRRASCPRPCLTLLLPPCRQPPDPRV